MLHLHGCQVIADPLMGHLKVQQALSHPGPVIILGLVGVRSLALRLQQNTVSVRVQE